MNIKHLLCYKRVLYAAACIVVFATVYSLILPAITMERKTYCGLEEHTHSDACYETTETCVCGQEEAAGHEHTDDCYTEETILVCELEENEEHSHTEDCYETDKILTCGKQETPGHTHTEECFEKNTELICGKEEHVHSDECFVNPETETASEETAEEETEETSASADAATEENTAEETAEAQEETTAEDAGKETAAEEASFVQNLTAEGKDYHITVTCSEKAGIPESAKLVVEEIKNDSAEYDGFVSDTEKTLEVEEGNVSYARFFDITIVDENDTEIQPAEPVQVVITLADLADNAEDENAPQVVHFGEETEEIRDVELTTEKAAAEAAEEEKTDEDEEAPLDTVSFEAEGFSVYGVVSTSLHYVIDGTSGSLDVTVTYGKDAEIPAGAKLEVKEFAADSQEYADAREEVLKEDTAINESGETAENDSETAHFQAFDVTIYDQDGNEVEPKAPVSVSFSLLYTASEEEREVIQDTLEVHHLLEKDNETITENVLPVADDQSREVVVNDDTVRMDFVTSSFSTYTIYWNTNRGYITVNFNYVDENGNALNGRSDSTSIYHDQGDRNYTMAEYASDIDGYEYVGANYRNKVITSLRLTPNTTWYFDNYENKWVSKGNKYNRVFFFNGGDPPVYTESYQLYSPQTVSVNLVYRKKTPRKVHYGYIENGTFKEWENELIEDIGTPDFTGDQYNVRKEFSGKDYVTTRLNDPVNGTAISPLLQTDADGHAYWKYRIQTVNGEINEWEPFDRNDTDIYVIYRDTPTKKSYNTGDIKPEDLAAPAASKEFESNHDGTYDLVLGVTGKSNQAQQKTHANVVIVMDTSSSMNYTYSENPRKNLGYTRLSAAKSAVCDLADQLFKMNTSDDPAAIELAFVNFSHRVRNEQTLNTIYSGTDATNFKNMINAVTDNGGTNYDTAIEAANSILWNDADPVYVVFVTDGDTVSRGYLKYDENGDGRDHASDWDGGTYYNHAEDEYGNTYMERARSAAKLQVEKVLNSGKKFYSIGVFGNVQYLSAMGGTYLGQANNKEAIQDAFESILSEIKLDLGYKDVVVNDGLTALTSTTLEHGSAGNFTYYRSGGKNTNGTEKYDSTQNNGRGVIWNGLEGTDKEAFFLEIKDENTFLKNGSVWTGITAAQKTDYIEKYGVGSRTVIWDLGEEMLEDGVTYKVAFTIWPSQEAYDLVADLNNGTVKMKDLDASVTSQIVESGGVYYVRTNTKATVDYKSVRTENGVVTEEKTGSETIKDPEGKMNLDTNLMTVRKDFAHLINEVDPYEEIVFYLTVDGQYYNKDGSLSETLDKEKVYAIHLPKDGKWEDTIYIAPGLMRGGDILETGHNYSLIEEIVSGNPYEYEFAPQTVRPMVITAVPTFLVKKDNFNKNTDGKQEYTFNDVSGKYTKVTGSSTAAGTYYAASENNGSLVGVNHKTSELDITKFINDPQNLLTDAQEASDTFTYRVTLQIPDGTDPSGIVGYEYVPRTQTNAFTLFGYQTGQSAFAEDIARFNGKTYRGWNTLVYDALIEYERITENGKTVIKAKRDADGNIMWKVPAVGGYHTITYDMTLKQDEVIRFTNLPTGTKYTIREIYANKYPADNVGGKTDGRAPVTDGSNLDAEGYMVEKVQHTGGTLSSDKTTVEGTIEAPDSRYYNRFTNKKVKEDKTTRVELKVKKEVEDYTWGEEYYRFTLTPGTASYSDAEGGTGTSPMPEGTQNAAVSIYESTPDHTLSFGRIRYTRPGTFTYTVSEYDNSNNMPNVEFAAPVVLTVTVTADGSGKLVVKNVVDDKGTSVYTAEEGAALAAGLTTQTNTTKKIQIRKVDKDHPEKVLADAAFEIRSEGILMYLQDGKLLTQRQVEEIIEMAVSADGAEKAMKKAGISEGAQLGEIRFGGFELDKVYELKEISPPDGYILTNGSVYFKVIKENANVYLRLTDQNGTILTGENGRPVLENESAVVSENGLSISVKNEPGAALPSTGGPGTGSYVLGGIMLILGAALLYCVRLLRRC